jgi:MoxR-like ATPase
MPQIAKVTDSAHPKKGYWFLIVRDGNSQCAGNFLDGTGNADPEGQLILRGALGSRFNCPAASIDRIHNAFARFPVRVYGSRTSVNTSGEYEINAVQGDAIQAAVVSAIKPGASMKRGPSTRSSNVFGSSTFGSGSAGTAVLDAPDAPVLPAKPPKPVVKIEKKVNPSVAGLGGSPQDGSPVVSVDSIALFLDMLDVKQSVMIWGPSGVGKSDAVQDWSHERGKKIFDVRLSMIEPTEIKGVGVPDFHEQRTKWFPAEFIPNEPNCVLFLDEITTAPPTIQALAYQITLNRMIGSTPLPDDCVVICAGNRVTDRGVAYQMPSPLANRLFHLTVKEDIATWRNWALSRGIDARIISFLTLRPEYLHKMTPTTSGEAWPSPRSWAAVNRVLNSKLNPVHQGVGVASLVGTAAAREFVKHCEGYDKSVRRIDDILNGLAKDYVETDPSRAQTVVVALVANATDDPEILENVISWLRNPNLNDEYRNLGLRGLEERLGSDVLQTIPSYTGAVVEDDSADVLPF